MNTSFDLDEVQEIVYLLYKDNSPEAQVLKTVLTDFLHIDPCKFRKTAPQGYTAAQCYMLLIHSAMLNTSLSAAALDLLKLGIRVPSGETVLNQLKRLKLAELMSNMDKLFHRQWKHLPATIRSYLSGQLVISLDIVQHPYYGDITQAQVVGGKKKGSSTQHHTYGSAKILWEGHGLTMASRMLYRGQERRGWVQEILAQTEQYGQPLLLLADGGFWINELLWDWAQRGYGFIVHVCGSVSNSPIPKELQREAKRTKAIQVDQYTIQFTRSKRALPLRLIAWADSNGKTHCIGVPTYLDDLPAAWLVSLYRSRFCIETGYRVWNDLRPRTTSREQTIRYTLVASAIALYNAYSIVRTDVQLAEAPQSRYWRRLVRIVRRNASRNEKKQTSSPTDQLTNSSSDISSSSTALSSNLSSTTTPKSSTPPSRRSRSVHYNPYVEGEITVCFGSDVYQFHPDRPNPPPKDLHKTICTDGPLSKKFARPVYFLTLKGLKSTWLRILTTLSNWIKEISYNPQFLMEKPIIN